MHTLSENIQFKPQVFSTTSAASAAAGWLSTATLKVGLAQYTRIVGTGELTSLRLDVAATSNGSGTTATVKSFDVTTLQPDAVGDNIVLDFTAAEVLAAAVAAGIQPLYISVVGVHATATEKALVTVAMESLRPHFALTAGYCA